MEDIKTQLDSLGIVPDVSKDQFFLADNAVINRMVEIADINKNDVVLEIGAGLGNLTRVLAKNTKKVIAFEIDKRFKLFLSNLPKNVEIHYEDAWEYVQLHGKYKKSKEYNKIVSNLPYSFCEKFLHNLTFLNYDKAILLVPLKFVNKIQTNGIFNSFFNCELKEIVNKNKFYPVRKTNSALIDLKKLPDPIKEKNLSLFLKQYIYQHEGQRVKNSIREGLIIFAKQIHNINLTKNESRDLINSSGIDSSLLNQIPSSNEIYNQISLKFASDIIRV